MKKIKNFKIASNFHVFSFFVKGGGGLNWHNLKFSWGKNNKFEVISSYEGTIWGWARAKKFNS